MAGLVYDIIFTLQTKLGVDDKIKNYIFTFEAEYSSDVKMFLVSSTFVE